MPTRRHVLALPLAALAARGALAQAYPNRPVKLVVAFPAASSTDIVARAIGPKLADFLGQNFVVENRPGAGGNIASALVAKEKPDGHTLLVHSVAVSVNPSLYRDAKYDLLRDLVMVGFGGLTPNALYVHPSVPANSLAELIALARAKPMSYASSGTGTTTHLGPELLFRKLVGIEVTHVPFSPAETATQVAGGNVLIGSTSLPPALQFIKTGRLKPIAVTSAARAPELPEVPTVAELGYAGFEATTWFGFFAPRETPAEIVTALNAAINRAHGTPELKAQFEAAGLKGQTMSVPELARFAKAEVEKWGQVVKVSGAKAD